MDRIGLAFIGFGHRASGSLKNELTGIASNVLKNKDFEIRSVCDAKESALSKAAEFIGPQIKTSKDYTETLKDKNIDAVIIAVPQYLHKEITVRAFAAGKHVYCEKPLALSVKDCDIMCESAKKSGKVFMVGQQMRYHNHIHRVVDYIKDGKIGKPVMAWLREFRNPFPSTMQWIFDKSKSGGMLMDKSCHHFDLFNWFLNSEPVSVFASGAPDVFPDAYSTGKILEDNAFVTIDYANGARAMLHLCMFTGRPHYSAEVSVGTRSREFGVIGSEGMLRAEGFDLGKNIELRFNHSGNVIRETVETFGNEPGRFNQTGNVGILMDFAECIRTGKKPFAAGDIGRMSVAVAVAGEISMAEKRIVKIDEVL